MSGDRVLGNRCDGHKLGFQKTTKFASSTTLLYLTMTNNMSGTAETLLFDHSTSIRLMRVLVIPCACVLMCVRTRGVIRSVARPPRPRGAFRPRARPGSRPPGQVTDSLPSPRAKRKWRGIVRAKCGEIAPQSLDHYAVLHSRHLSVRQTLQHQRAKIAQISDRQSPTHRRHARK